MYIIILFCYEFKYFYKIFLCDRYVLYVYYLLLYIIYDIVVLLVLPAYKNIIKFYHNNFLYLKKYIYFIKYIYYNQLDASSYKKINIDR